MPDESGRIRPISVPKVWPGHRDYVPDVDSCIPATSKVLPEPVARRRLRPHPFGFGAWEVIEDEPGADVNP